MQNELNELRNQVRTLKRVLYTLCSVGVLGGLLAATNLNSVPDVIQAKKFEVGCSKQTSKHANTTQGVEDSLESSDLITEFVEFVLHCGFLCEGVHHSVMQSKNNPSAMCRGVECCLIGGWWESGYL
jgi:hypothetical protein